MEGASLDGVKYIAMERSAMPARREKPPVVGEVGVSQNIVQSDTPSRQAATIICISAWNVLELLAGDILSGRRFLRWEYSHKRRGGLGLNEDSNG